MYLWNVICLSVYNENYILLPDSVDNKISQLVVAAGVYLDDVTN